MNLREVRLARDLTQREMAAVMGIAWRTYQDLEAKGGEADVRHALAAHYGLMELAVLRGQPELATNEGRDRARHLARLMEG